MLLSMHYEWNTLKTTVTTPDIANSFKLNPCLWPIKNYTPRLLFSKNYTRRLLFSTEIQLFSMKSDYSKHIFNVPKYSQCQECTVFANLTIFRLSSNQKLSSLKYCLRADAFSSKVSNLTSILSLSANWKKIQQKTWLCTFKFGVICPIKLIFNTGYHSTVHFLQNRSLIAKVGGWEVRVLSL